MKNYQIIAFMVKSKKARDRIKSNHPHRQCFEAPNVFAYTFFFIQANCLCESLTKITLQSCFHIEFEKAQDIIKSNHIYFYFTWPVTKYLHQYLEISEILLERKKHLE